MRQRNILRRAMLIFSIVFAITTAATSNDASAQVTIVCPPGYAYLAGYGCEPLQYFYGPPYYTYPDYGFGLFYGRRGWGRGFGGRGFGGHGFGHGGGHGGRR